MVLNKWMVQRYTGPLFCKNSIQFCWNRLLTLREAYKWKINTQINISALVCLCQKKSLRTHFGFSLYRIKEHTLLPSSFLLSKRRLSFLRILKIPQGGDTNTFQTVSVIQGTTDTCRRPADWSGVYRDQAVREGGGGRYEKKKPLKLIKLI